MKVLVITNMMPSAATPRAGTFIEQQIVGLRDVGLDVSVVLVDRAGRGVSTYSRTSPAVREGLQLYSPDIVHIMYGGVMADLATAVCRSVPAVVSFCGVDLLGARYGSLFYRLRTWLGVRASYRAAGRATGIVVKSRNLERGLPREIDRRRVHIIPNGVSLERFRPLDRHRCQERLGWDPSVFHVLFSTTDRRDPKKRLPLAEAAVDRLVRDGLRAEIHGLKNIPHPEVPVWLNAADVVLMTSREDEGSPNIIKEALACNRPVVSVDVGDVGERIQGIDGCYLAEPTAGDIATKLMHVARGERVVSARESIRELSLETVAERLRDVYDQSIAAHSAETARRESGKHARQTR